MREGECAADGREALDHVTRQAYDGIFLDVRMPDMRCVEGCRPLNARRETASSPILLISAESSTEDVAAGFAAGCDDYLPKPFSPRELVHRVDQLLARSA